MSIPQTPAISVLMPCRDAAAFLPECIASLDAQTFQRFEVLTLDDGSRDETGQLLAEWAERDPRVRIFEREGDGIVAALRRLAREVRASLIARMDADDVSHPERLGAQLELLDRSPTLTACGTGVRYVPRPAEGSGYLRYERWLNSLIDPDIIDRDLFVECPIAHPTLMVRRDAFAAVDGYRESDGPEDYDLILRLAASGARLSNVPRVLHDWRLGEHRLSERSDRYSPDAFRALKIEHLKFRVPTDRPLVVWGAGSVGKAFCLAWMDAGAQRVTKFVDLDPRKIGQTIHGADVIAPEGLAHTPPGERRPFVLVAVGSPGARDEIREALRGMSFLELVDFRVVA